MKRLFLTFLLISSFASSNCGFFSVYQNTKALIGAGLVTGGCLSVGTLAGGYATHKIAHTLYNHYYAKANPKKNLDAKAGVMLAGIGSAGALLASYYNASRAIFRASYMQFSGMSLQVPVAQKASEHLQDYLIALLLLDKLEAQFNSIMAELNSKKYHESRDATRLELLDGAYYHIKAGDLLIGIQSARARYKKSLGFYLDELSGYGLEDKALQEKMGTLRAHYEDFLNSFHIAHLGTVYRDVSQAKYPEFYSIAQKLSTHSKLFVAGFNEGINVIDEAIEVNELAHDMFAVLKNKLERVGVELQESLKELKELCFLEKLLYRMTGKKIEPCKKN